MDATLWALTALLAAAFVAAGLFKLLQPHGRVVAHAPWAGDFSPAHVKLIGIVELLGVAGLLVPPLVGVATWLVPVAAAGLALDMAVATAVHVRRRDPTHSVAISVVLGVAAIVVAVGRGVA